MRTAQSPDLWGSGGGRARFAGCLPADRGADFQESPPSVCGLAEPGLRRATSDERQTKTTLPSPGSFSSVIITKLPNSQKSNKDSDIFLKPVKCNKALPRTPRTVTKSLFHGIVSARQKEKPRRGKKKDYTLAVNESKLRFDAFRISNVSFARWDSFGNVVLCLFAGRMMTARGLVMDIFEIIELFPRFRSVIGRGLLCFL